VQDFYNIGSIGHGGVGISSVGLRKTLRYFDFVAWLV
jgi:hypothetical protein